MVLALILAAGRGERLGAGQPKALAQLAGRPLYSWSFEVLRRVPAVQRIVLALPSGVTATGVEVSAEVEVGTGVEVSTVVGGATRSESVRLALAAGVGVAAEPDGVGAAAEPDGVGVAAEPDGVGAAAAQSELVLVHDAARPLLTAALCEAVIAAVRDSDLDGAIAATPVTDTVKRVDAENIITESLDRSSLWAVQTPQVFRRSALERALDVPAEVLAQATDDAWLVERAGGRVAVVQAPRENLKITTPFDLRLAELLLASRPA